MKTLNNIGSAVISRRTLLAGSVAAGSAPLLLATQANATVKVPKAVVHFADAANTVHTCGTCKHFMGPSNCRFVEGAVSANCSCWIWSGKVA